MKGNKLMNTEKNLELIEKISNIEIDELGTNFEIIETYFKLCYFYVTESQLSELKFEESFDGIFKFSNWIHNQLYKGTDPLYTINEIFLFNKIENNFTKLFKKFDVLINDYSIKKMELYNELDAEIWYRYKEFINGNI